MIRALPILTLIVLATISCKTPPQHVLKYVRHVRVEFGQSRSTLRYSNDRFALRVGTLAPQWPLSSLLGNILQLPLRRTKIYSTFHTAGRLSGVSGTLSSAIKRFYPIIFNGSMKRPLVPEFYTVRIQDQKLKFYGLFRGNKRIKIVHTYAIHDGENSVLMRTSILNLAENDRDEIVRGGVYLAGRGLTYQRGSTGRKRSTMTHSNGVIGWCGRGFEHRQAFVGGGIVLTIAPVVLRPGEEITFAHSLHLHRKLAVVESEMRLRQTRAGGIFVRRR